jgi:hypothetical protein
MIHKIVSFYQNDLPKEIVTLQKRVFDFFDLDIEQIEWNIFEHTHTGAIENYLIKNENYDFISLFDVDCIPITSNWKSKTIKILEDENTVYGNAQASNVFRDINPHPSPPFINGGVFNISYKVWRESNYKQIGVHKYVNPDGHLIESDGYEALTRELEKQGRNVVLAYPIFSTGDNTWIYGGEYGYPKFGYGNGVTYESDTFHNFQIRLADKRVHFLKKCKSILGEKFYIEEFQHLMYENK